MSKSRLILVVTFVLAMAAGGVVGRVWPRKENWLADQLNLTADQQTKIDSIWNETTQKNMKFEDRRRQLDRERDQAIQELLSPAQWAAYGKVYDEFNSKRNELRSQQRKLFDEAEQRSKAILDEEQVKRWEAIKSMRLHSKTPTTHRAADH